ncbi:2892_t:CDS:10, partial [Cetraspora pellucida]
EIKQWLEIGLSAYEYDLVTHLKNEKKLDLEGIKTNLTELRKEYNPISWRDIHSKFTPELRKEWEEKGFTREQVKEWVKGGDDHNLRSQLRLGPEESETGYFVVIEKLREEFNNLEKFDFDYQKAKGWVEKGLNPYDADFAFYLEKKGENFLPEVTLNNLPKLRSFSACKCNIKKLTITNCPELQKLDVAFNSLADLDFLNDLDTKKLTSLNVCRNSFPHQSVQDLFSSSLNKFESLETLDLSTNDILKMEYVVKKVINLTIDANQKKLLILRLKGFVQLERLDCSRNQLTSLGLSDCPNLVELKCDNNKFDDLSFLKFVGKLKRLEIQNNQELSKQNLSILTSLKELRYLNISDCPFEGNLKPLQNLSNLRELYIIDTNISEGLEYLTENCEKLYCNSDYPHKSTKIMEELDKSKEDKNNQTELEKLKSPEQFKKFEYLTGVEYASTATTMVGGVLTLLDFSTTGGVITLVAPAIGAGASQLRSTLYDAKKTEDIETSGKYDHDSNEEIDIEELIKCREKFSNELDKVEEIIEAMKKLEEKEEIKQKLEREKKEEVPTTVITSFPEVINELSEQIKVDEKLKDEIEKKLEKIFPKTKKIVFLLKGEKENQVLVISRIENGEKKVSEVEIIKNPCQKILSGQIREGIKDSQEGAIEKYLEIVEIKLEKEQRGQIREKAQQIVDDEKRAKEIKEELPKKIQERLIRLLAKKLLEKEAKNLQKGETSLQAHQEIPPKK